MGEGRGTTDSRPGSSGTVPGMRTGSLRTGPVQRSGRAEPQPMQFFYVEV